MNPCILFFYNVHITTTSISITTTSSSSFNDVYDLRNQSIPAAAVAATTQTYDVSSGTAPSNGQVLALSPTLRPPPPPTHLALP
ncbi:hypothetical protein FRB91_001335 [Serendipita sp. 411]|nr:hypothetical protein FRB91_001335 [Serendipita sp. 411]